MNIQGIVIGGLVKGLRERKWDGKVVGYELGMSAQVADGFGGFAEELMIVRLNEDQQPAVKNAVDKLRGKQALVQVNVGAYVSKGKGVAQFNYVPDSQIIALDDVDPFSGEVKDSLKSKAA
ncbi:DNA-binding protein [uncultured Shewanella sp.]|uniref:DNA-binding protein n=1 Tax=uncultured Shewanella sp. TaxID=173975 RepID=UPI002616A8D6|nr:DNA-binding protein [uncultured Shewanella sp.]